MPGPQLPKPSQIEPSQAFPLLQVVKGSLSLVLQNPAIQVSGSLHAVVFGSLHAPPSLNGLPTHNPVIQTSPVVQTLLSLQLPPDPGPGTHCPNGLQKLSHTPLQETPTVGAPTQNPAAQVSSSVHSSPSLQALPVVGLGEQIPVIHESGASHVPVGFGFPQAFPVLGTPTHSPTAQTSPVVH